MFTANWSTSPREHEILVTRDVHIPMSDGITLSADIFRPRSEGRFPALLGIHAYDHAMQTVPSVPEAMTGRNASNEAGDPNFFVRRGYAHAVVNVRGTGRSQGLYNHYGARATQDTCEVIDWLSKQSWCDGGVGMFGVSHFAVAAKQAAALDPPALKAVFGIFGMTDFYRDKFYHGGILAHTFLTSWAKHLSGIRVDPYLRQALGDEEYERRLELLRQDQDIMAVPELAGAVNQPGKGAHPLILEALMNPLDGPYWQERAPILENIKAPVMLGACWGMYGLHLPGTLRDWERIRAPKKMFIGPPIYLDRPVYQYAEEALRWFDHWLKGIDTGTMDEPPVNLFLMGEDGSWKEGVAWPLAETKWHPFFLHKGGLLSEHEFWPHEGGTSFEDNLHNGRGGATFTSPPMVERTEVVGPVKLDVYVSTTSSDVLLFVTLWDVPPEGDPRLLTRGWLRGTLRDVDRAKSKPWYAHHSFTEPHPLLPDVPQLYEVNIAPTANVFKIGHRIAVRISSTDDDPIATFLDATAQGHLLRQDPAWITIHHDQDHPSLLHLPIVSGNRIGTYMSGGMMRRPIQAGGARTGWDRF